MAAVYDTGSTGDRWEGDDRADHQRPGPGASVVAIEWAYLKGTGRVPRDKGFDQDYSGRAYDDRRPAQRGGRSQGGAILGAHYRGIPIQDQEWGHRWSDRNSCSRGRGRDPRNEVLTRVHEEYLVEAHW